MIPNWHYTCEFILHNHHSSDPFDRPMPCGKKSQMEIEGIHYCKEHGEIIKRRLDAKAESGRRVE